MLLVFPDGRSGWNSVAGKGQIQAIARKSHVFELNIPLLFNSPLPDMSFH